MTPTTDAGRALLAEWDVGNPEDPHAVALVAAILAIEREGAAAERERITRAILDSEEFAGFSTPYAVFARLKAILAEPSE